MEEPRGTEVQPPESPTPEPSEGRKLLNLAAEIIAKYKVPHALLTFFLREWKGLKMSLALVVVLLVCVSVAVSWGISGIKNMTIHKMEHALSDTNLYYQAVLKTLRDDKQDLQKTIGDNTITFNEKLREKDVEISDIKNERSVLQTRVTFLETLPHRISEIASNMEAIHANTPTNLSAYFALAGSIDALTNSLAKYSADVGFAVTINGIELTNWLALPFPTNGDLLIEFKNIGSFTAADVNVDFCATTGSTNITADGWTLTLPGTIFNQQASHWKWRAETPVPTTMAAYCVSSLKLSTNLVDSHLMCRLSIFGSNAKAQDYVFGVIPK
ncbi:MAG TPA: hypothetical protein VHC44_16345 [Verrucomicrobiae bacterium]|nr:hypothetical protein [Verrucomicrobiae bacterium]